MPSAPQAADSCLPWSCQPSREMHGGQGASHELVAWCLLPLGSSACLASLRSAAAKLEDGAAWADSALLVAGLPVGTRAPLSGEGVRGLTVAVVLVAVESIPMEGDLGSWLMPETGKEEPVSPTEQSASARVLQWHAARARGRESRAQPALQTADPSSRSSWPHGSEGTPVKLNAGLAPQSQAYGVPQRAICRRPSDPRETRQALEQLIRQHKQQLTGTGTEPLTSSPTAPGGWLNNCPIVQRRKLRSVCGINAYRMPKSLSGRVQSLPHSPQLQSPPGGRGWWPRIQLTAGPGEVLP